MTLLALGINHKTANLALLEQIAFNSEQTPSALDALRNSAALDETALLSTCNRTEIYCAAQSVERATQEVLHWLCCERSIDQETLNSSCYRKHGTEVFEHLVTVASGLDSMIVGEAQIFGQVKEAYARAREHGCVLGQLSPTFEQAFGAVKRVRSETEIGVNPLSVTSLAIKLSLRIFDAPHNKNLLFVGAGNTIELCAKRFDEHSFSQITIANRNLEKALRIAEGIGGRAAALGDLPQLLAETDILVSATSSPLPIIGKGAIEERARASHGRALLIVDLAMPRDVEPAANDVRNVYLYGLKDLRQLAEDNRSLRDAELAKAQVIIEEETQNFLKRRRAHSASGQIERYRKSVENIRDSELRRAMRHIEQGKDPDEALNALAERLAAKLMHSPGALLRQAYASEQSEVITWANRWVDGICKQADELIERQTKSGKKNT